VDFGMYHACFPQLIAGPIVRYEEVAAQLRQRPVRLDDLYGGAVQFCFGLAKKAILADPAGVVADKAFDLHGSTLTFGSAWLGILAYTLQIYLDFSGYSDMAIGLGRMLGFGYPENFDQPYRSRSITEFWRRWHMTLSRWFRDYLYIPLGGNRAGLRRTLLNLGLVFFLCGLWHGAAVSFVVWGLYHGALLVNERLLHRWVGWKLPGYLGWPYSIVAVMVGWVFFRADSLDAAGHYLGAMLPPGKLALDPLLGSVLTNDKIAYIALGVAVSLIPWRPFFAFAGGRYQFGPIAAGASLLLACYAAVMLSVGGFTPFIYFRF
jgi:alginate O-acetyltransferase complex protein AlgI